MTSKEKRQLRAYIFTLYVTPFYRLNILYQTLKSIYLSKYLSMSYTLSFENDIDQQVADEYLKSLNKLTYTEFLFVYSATCKVMATRLQKGNKE